MAKIVKKRELRKRQRVAERQGGVPRRYNAVMSQKIPAAFCLMRENVLFLWIGIINPRFETMRKFLFLIMALGALGAMAGETFVSGGLKYTEIGNGFVKVGKISDEAQPKGTLVIPPTVKHGGEIYVVSKIDSWGFFGCRGITRVQLPPTLTVIDIWAFTCCESLLGIDIPSSVTEIGYAAFETCTSFTSFTFPAGVTKVSERVLQECVNLREVSIPEGVTVIENSAFSSCKSLPTIRLPQTVRQIGSYSFAYCDSLRSIPLPAGVERLGNDVFSCCQALESIELPEGLTEIGNNAFHYCSSLREITLPASLTTVTGNPFTSCKALERIAVAPGSRSYAVSDGILFSKDMTRLVFCPVSKETGNYVVPATVTAIASRAFFECGGLTGIKMTGVVTIGESAFYNCDNLSNVDFGTRLQSMGKSAFYSNSKIEHIVLPDSFEHLGVTNFDFCGNLRTVSVAASLFQRMDDFNNFSFQFNSDDLRFVLRQPDGTTLTTEASQLPDAKGKYLPKHHGCIVEDVQR